MLADSGLAKTNIYKQVTQQGQVEYSDQPDQNSTEILLPQIQINAAILPKTGSPSSTPASVESVESTEHANEAQKSSKIQVSISISSPIEQQFFISAITEVPVALVVQPALSPTQKIKILLDNQPYGEPSHALNLTLKNVERGSHELKAIIIEDNNQIIASSAPVTFYQQRQQIKKP